MTQNIKRRLLVIDNSNLYIGGAQQSAVAKGLSPSLIAAVRDGCFDPLYRPNYHFLFDYLVGSNGDAVVELHGSGMPTGLIGGLERMGHRVIDYPRSSRGKEKQVDVGIATSLMRQVAGVERLDEFEVVLVSGDNDFAPLVSTLRELGVGRVVVASWSQTLGRTLQVEASEVVLLDPYLEFLTAA